MKVQCTYITIFILNFQFQKAMEDLGFHPEEIVDIFRIMSAVLKLGNINFIPTTNMDGTDGCAISNDYGKCDLTTALGHRCLSNVY